MLPAEAKRAVPTLARKLSVRRGASLKSCDVIFASADRDGDGFLNLAELRSALELLPMALPDELEAKELAALLEDIASSDNDDEIMQEVFEEINRSKTGLISFEEFSTCEFFEVDD